MRLKFTGFRGTKKWLANLNNYVLSREGVGQYLITYTHIRLKILSLGSLFRQTKVRILR